MKYRINTQYGTAIVSQEDLFPVYSKDDYIPLTLERESNTIEWDARRQDEFKNAVKLIYSNQGLIAAVKFVRVFTDFDLITSKLFVESFEKG